MNAISKPQSHADAAATALRNALSDGHAALRDAVTSYRTACASLTPDADLLDVFRAAGNIVLVAEAINAASKQAETTARAALAQAMSETGCPAVALAAHTVHLSTKPARVDIENAQDIPAEFMRQPPPALDRVAIGKCLRAGIAVPGARLLSDNQEPIVVFKGRSS
jgi:Siphovirus Gp157